MSSENKEHQIDDLYVIEDLDTLKKLTHPQRVEILHTLQSPKTVKLIAAEIDADPTKLYYHIRQMEQIGAIRVVETNIVSGIVEKKYLVTANSYQVKENLFSGEDQFDTEVEFPKMMAAVFKSTVKHAERSAKAGLIEIPAREDKDKPISVAIMSNVVTLNEDQLEEFSNRMQSLMKEFVPETGPENEESSDRKSVV